MTYTDWARRYPAAALELITVSEDTVVSAPAKKQSEAWVQQQVRFKAAQFGARAWRNNVGATPTKCSQCGSKQRPIRYGLANDSMQLNQQIKSSDLILAIPRVITADMVGGTIAQFGGIECKRSGWHYTGRGSETAQAAWLTLIKSLGGFAEFSTGDLNL